METTKLMWPAFKTCMARDYKDICKLSMEPFLENCIHNSSTNISGFIRQTLGTENIQKWMVSTKINLWFMSLSLADIFIRMDGFEGNLL
jgi:hypothetical protein